MHQNDEPIVEDVKEKDEHEDDAEDSDDDDDKDDGAQGWNNLCSLSFCRYFHVHFVKFILYSSPVCAERVFPDTTTGKCHNSIDDRLMIRCFRFLYLYLFLDWYLIQ